MIILCDVYILTHHLPYLVYKYAFNRSNKQFHRPKEIIFEYTAKKFYLCRKKMLQKLKNRKIKYSDFPVCNWNSLML